ncbi:hypothetical protein [Fluviicola chungangensis]|uniref:Uncharacterized protein n=1 Tax=Fluviicola chungangensis TaxID=2597671 RepID=A0A556MY95_9FLAO|nr:hypothetical protein [Fluviicola chungangensis]TSJ44803.1 hypothetical protein FO442_09390 [Fluviicola chungangensis]
MTEEEILTVLRIESPDEVEEALELELFGIRKSVLGKPLLRLTLKSKWSRLDLLNKIAIDQQLFSVPEATGFRYELEQTDEVLPLWESYMKAKSRWKMAFTQAQSPATLMVLLEEGLKMERAFAEQFIPSDWIEEEPVFGVEPDPMLVQNGLKQAAQKAWLTFADLEKNKSELEKDFLLALKRLSLLPKYL